MWYTPRYVQQPFPGDNNFSFVVRKNPVTDSRAKPKQKLDAKKRTTNNGGSKVVQKKQPKEKKSPVHKVDKAKKKRKKKDQGSKRSIDENNFI